MTIAEELTEKTKELSLFSYNIEEKREQSLFDQAGKILTSISIFTVAVLSFISLEKFNFNSEQTAKILGITFVPLVLSFISVILTQWRSSY
jgi:hypothetical protein